MLRTASSKASVEALKTIQWVSCFWYPTQFKNIEIRALIDFKSKVNAMTLAYIAKLGFVTQKTEVGAQKIDSSLLETHSIASAVIILQNSLGRMQFFEEAFLLNNTSIKVILQISFLSFSNVDVEFTKLGKLT